MSAVTIPSMLFRTSQRRAVGKATLISESARRTHSGRPHYFTLQDAARRGNLRDAINDGFP